MIGRQNSSTLTSSADPKRRIDRRLVSLPVVACQTLLGHSHSSLTSANNWPMNEWEVLKRLGPETGIAINGQKSIEMPVSPSLECFSIERRNTLKRRKEQTGRLQLTAPPSRYWFLMKWGAGYNLFVWSWPVETNGKLVLVSTVNSCSTFHCWWITNQQRNAGSTIGSPVISPQRNRPGLIIREPAEGDQLSRAVGQTLESQN